MGARIAVRVIALAMRRGVSKAEARELLARVFRHREEWWRERIVMLAQARNHDRPQVLQRR